MKQKLKLNLAHEAGEVLTREELKKVLGGTGSGSGEDICAGIKSFTKCFDKNGDQIGEAIESIGCESTVAFARCTPEATRHTCSCAIG